MAYIGVKFKPDGETYCFSSTEKLNINQKVIVETKMGKQLGITTDKFTSPENEEIKEIIRLATDADYEKYLKNLKDAKKAIIETKALIKKLKLNMNLIDAIYSLDKKVLFFNFVSEERVDFRELVKQLASKYHTRIELHQIGVRDKAKEIGGLGLCGRPLCCKNHLSCVGSVNINMVKNQNIALNPTKINGACGRLLCCFTYENEIYEDNRNSLPNIGDTIKRNGKEAKVVELDILNKKYKIKYADNTIEEVDNRGSSE